MDTFNKDTIEKKKEFSRLVDAYLSGTADEREKSVLNQYFDLFSAEPDVLEDLNRTEVREIHDRLLAGINERIAQQEPGLVPEERPVAKFPWRYLSAAAVLLLISAVGLWFYRADHSIVPVQNKVKIIADVAPGGNKAILTLANGTRVSLNGKSNGNIASQFGVSVDQTKEGVITYRRSGEVEKQADQTAYNSIEVPKGGQYQLVLSDGSKVWLNAASSLRYPLHFQGNERKVELSGEGYFEVAKNKTKPFKVVTEHQMVEVLGTHFNVNSYKDEQVTRTSLLEGSVKVSSLKSGGVKKVLAPGQQSTLGNNSSGSSGQNITVQNIDPDGAVAWKNGYFMFEDESLISILRKVSRWYDVDIQFEDPDLSKELRFNGTISKYNNVSKVLKKLELTQAIHFKIDGRKIIVITLNHK